MIRMPLNRAAAASQYALIVGLIAVVALAAIGSLGGNVALLSTRVANALGNSAGTGGTTGGSASGGGEAQPVYATWSATDKSPAIALSNGNLTASLGAAANNLQGLRAGKSLAVKSYWEVTLSASGYAKIGIANGSWCIGNGSVGTTPPNGGCYDAANLSGWDSYDGGLNYGGAISAYGTGALVRVAYDPGTGRLWLGDTASGCRWRAVGGGATTSNDLGTVAPVRTGLSGSQYPAVLLQSYLNTTPGVTANFGATGFACAVPSGYNAGVY